MEVFNLGGTDESAVGLQRFKSGFGAREVKLESARFYLGSQFKRRIFESVAKLYNSSLTVP